MNHKGHKGHEGNGGDDVWPGQEARHRYKRPSVGQCRRDD